MNDVCKYCGLPISTNFYYCPTCGKKLIQPPLSTSLGKQIKLYAISFFLPPFGLWPSIKYILDNNEKAKIIGLVGVVLTIVSLAITISLVASMLNNPLISGGNQLQTLQDLGY